MNNITTNQYLLFYVGGIIYAIKALDTSEIVEYSPITKVPMMPSSVKGVTNIRGSIVPVVDLLDRLGLGESTISKKTSVVVINDNVDGVTTKMGIIIDEVYEVEDIDNKYIRNKPDFGSKINKKFISCMLKYNDEYITVLNTAKILDTKELSEVNHAKV